MYTITQHPTLYPEGLAIVEKRSQKVTRRNHRKAVLKSRSYIDNNCPRQFPKRVRNSYKMISEIRHINSNNQNFIDRLLTTPSDPTWEKQKYFTHSYLNYPRRLEVQRDITKKNREMTRRIRTADAVYKKDSFVPKYRNETLRLRSGNTSLFIKQNTHQIQQYSHGRRWNSEPARKLRKAKSTGNLLVTNARPTNKNTADDTHLYKLKKHGRTMPQLNVQKTLQINNQYNHQNNEINSNEKKSSLQFEMKSNNNHVKYTDDDDLKQE